MLFQPSLSFFGVVALTALSLTSCTSEQWVDPAGAAVSVPELNLMNPVVLESVSWLNYPENSEGLTWALVTPLGEQIWGPYVLSPEGQPVIFDDFEPIVLDLPSDPYQIQLLHRSEFNHEVSFHVINSFQFAPADAISAPIFLGKPGKISARLILSELN